MIPRSKTRIRTAAELEARAECFHEVSQILDKLRLEYFIQGGVLLGARREGYFIPWDWDVEFSIFSIQAVGFFDELVELLLDCGYQITKKDASIEDLKINFFKGKSSEPTSFTIFGWWHDERRKVYRRKTLQVPEHFFQNLESIEFLGKRVPCPSDVDAYLTHQYGDWWIPKKTSDKFEYLTKSFSDQSSSNRTNSFVQRLDREWRQLKRNIRSALRYR
jgi:hypothetical protein